MKSAQDRLAVPVRYLKGIGPKRAALFHRIGVESVRDLLLLVPRRYVDRSRVLPIKNLRVGDEATVIGRIIASSSRQTKTFKRLVTIRVTDGTDTIEAVWFNRPDLVNRFRPQTEVMLSGRVTYYRYRQMVNPMFEILEPGGEFSYTNAIIPVYPLTEGLSVWTIRRAVRDALERFGSLPETLPNEVIASYGFPDIGEALRTVHFPGEVAQALRARRRLAYEELFYLGLLAALRRHHNRQIRRGRLMRETGQFTGEFRRLLRFQLTRAQERAITEIREDLAGDTCMGRLLQGDVGSGKTVVAVYAMLIACENRLQAAMMVPTEVLAEQHFRNWGALLEQVGVTAALLTGSTVPTERRRILAGLVSGEIQVIFGTHALIEQGVEFNQLGLVVVDEQHRFGVLQRAALLTKGIRPDLLVMTATPIPRTLALTLYGDLDYSLLDEKPPGRWAVETELVSEARRGEVYEFVARRVSAGEQVFVVCPLVEESEKLDLASAVETFQRVRALFPQYQVGLVHGRLAAQERQQLMEDFRSGHLQILVSTTVIEVGVDVPAATVMIIEHPERFGLAQLHQLRGRIGRGESQGYCFLMISAEAPAEYCERLRFFSETTDGFLLAERDLELRGPGEVLGTRQHGLPDLHVADILRDRELLMQARADAFRLVDSDPELKQPQNECIRRTLLAMHAERAELLGIG